MTGDPTIWIEVVRTGGVVAVLVVVIYGVMRGWWLPQRVHDQYIANLEEQLRKMETDRDFWRDFAIRSIAAAESAMEQSRGSSG